MPPADNSPNPNSVAIFSPQTNEPSSKEGPSPDGKESSSKEGAVRTSSKGRKSKEEWTPEQLPFHAGHGQEFYPGMGFMGMGMDGGWGMGSEWAPMPWGGDFGEFYPAFAAKDMEKGKGLGKRKGSKGGKSNKGKQERVGENFASRRFTTRRTPY